MNATTAPAPALRPLVLKGDTFKVNALDSFESVEIPGSALRGGMILVDDLGCPLAVVDHKMSTRQSKAMFMLIDLDENPGRYIEHGFQVNALVTVAAV